jgi:hypothetical protein
MNPLDPRVDELDELAINILKQRKTVDVPTIAAALGITQSSARRTLDRLRHQNRVHEQRNGRFVTFIYGGSVAPKRETPEYKPFGGVNWASSTMRPGCQDFLKAPSVVHGQPVEHRAPMHGCTSSAARFSGEAK